MSQTARKIKPQGAHTMPDYATKDDLNTLVMRLIQDLTTLKTQMKFLIALVSMVGAAIVSVATGYIIKQF